MINKVNNFAYINGANLHKALDELSWHLDYERFRIWLAEKYRVKRAYLFIGLIPRYKDLYTYLQEAGFTLVFKEVVYDRGGKAKGNCDAILVLNYALKGVKNYIGGNTFLEMGFAHVLNLSIYCINPLPEMDYLDELQAMQPIILNGDLSKIR